MVMFLAAIRRNRMANQMDGLSPSQRWALLVGAAKRAAEASGFSLKRVPGRGLSNVVELTKGGKSHRASIRTTRDRWIAFQPLNKGTTWKTLDDVESVLVAAVDDREDPKNIEVYLFPAEEVQKRFADAYKARIADGHLQKDSFGMWVSLDRDERGIAASVGSGIVDSFKPIAEYSIAELLQSHPPQQTEEAELPGEVEDSLPTLTTIAEVLSWARLQVAQIAGVDVGAVKLDLKMSLES
jgi:hypothetical protein